MKNLLPPKFHVKVSQYARILTGSCFILTGLTLAATALKGTSPSPHLPIIGWVPDQLVSVAGQGYATQYLQVIHDGSGVPSVDGSTNTSFYSTTDLSFARCTAGMSRRVARILPPRKGGLLLSNFLTVASLFFVFRSRATAGATFRFGDKLYQASK